MVSAKEIIGALSTTDESDHALVQSAYDFAKRAHEGHTRYSGEPYFIHPAEVGKHLAELGMDARVVAAGLLHDSVEDAKATEKEIEELFGKEVLSLVQGVTKLGTHKYRGLERHAESLRRLLVSTSTDIRVLIIKLMDRLHNMSTIEHVPPEKRRRIALETLDIYAPIAHRLGMGKIQRELEDLAFPHVDHDAYTHTFDIRKEAAKHAEKGLLSVRKRLARALVERGIHSFETSIRIKGLWSLYKKLERKEKDITKIYDIAALRVVVESVDDCYAALGVVHSLWKPIPGKFKDYIAFEKPNGYRSLHTTVLTGDAGVVEIQIRTKEMHLHAQYGIASHMSYKSLGDASKRAFASFTAVWSSLIPGLLRKTKEAEKKEGTPPPPKWLHDIASSHEDIFESKEYLENLKDDFFSHRVFVFTPHGDVVDLPIHSSPIDFAYAIHSDIGNHVSGAKVNGKLVSFDTQLSNGDVVDIITKKTAHPTAKWAEFVKTSLARRHIRAYTEQQEKQRR